MGHLTAVCLSFLIHTWGVLRLEDLVKTLFSVLCSLRIFAIYAIALALDSQVVSGKGSKFGIQPDLSLNCESMFS